MFDLPDDLVSGLEQAQVAEGFITKLDELTVTIFDTVFDVFLDLGEDEPREESWWSLQPDTDVLATVLKDCEHKRLPVASFSFFELCCFKAFDVVKCAQLLNLLDVLGDVTQLDNDTLTVDLYLTNVLFLLCSIVDICVFNSFEFFTAMLVQDIHDCLNETI